MPEGKPASNSSLRRALSVSILYTGGGRRDAWEAEDEAAAAGAVAADDDAAATCAELDAAAEISDVVEAAGAWFSGFPKHPSK